MILLIISISLSIISMIAVFYIITVLDFAKHQVLSIFTLLTTDTLLDTYSECSHYLRLLSDCSLMKLILAEEDSIKEMEEARPQQKRGAVSTSEGQVEREGKEMYALMVKRIYAEIKRQQ